MNRVAEWVLHASEVRRHRGVVFPQIAFWHNHIGGKTAVHIYPKNARVGTHMALIEATLKAFAANKMAFTAYVVPNPQLGHFAPDFDHLAGKLVPHNARWYHTVCRPGVPCVNMIVGSADRGGQHANFYLVRGCQLRLWHLNEARSGPRSCLYYGLHSPCLRSRKLFHIPVICVTAALNVLISPRGSNECVVTADLTEISSYR